MLETEFHVIETNDFWFNYELKVTRYMHHVVMSNKGAAEQLFHNLYVLSNVNIKFAEIYVMD